MWFCVICWPPPFSKGGCPFCFLFLADDIVSSSTIFQHWFISKYNINWRYSLVLVRLLANWASEFTHRMTTPFLSCASLTLIKSRSTLFSAPFGHKTSPRGPFGHEKHGRRPYGTFGFEKTVWPWKDFHGHEKAFMAVKMWKTTMWSWNCMLAMQLWKQQDIDIVCAGAGPDCTP